ncbi:MAG: integrin alpha [Myxococcota bacterium]
MRLFVSLLVACDPPLPEDSGVTGLTDDTAVPGDDADGDGFDADVDCDDRDATTYPGAPESLDGYVNDCDAPLGTTPDKGIAVAEGRRVLGNGNSFGYEAVAGEDVDGDGLDELVASAPGEPGVASFGAVYLFPGLVSAAPTSTSGATFSLIATGDGTAFGAETLFVDATPDAVPDFVVGAPADGDGAVWLLHGEDRVRVGAPSLETDGVVVHQITPDAGAVGFGKALAFDGEHLVVGAPIGQGGSVWIYDASQAVDPEGEPPEAAVIASPTAGGILGYDVTTLDWDNVSEGSVLHPDDLVIGVPGFGRLGADNVGAVAIFTTVGGAYPEYGTTTSWEIERSDFDFVAIVGEEADDYFGSVVANLGDVTLDGHDELLVATGGGDEGDVPWRTWYVIDLQTRIGDATAASGPVDVEDAQIATVTGLQIEVGPLGVPEAVEARDLDGDGRPDLIAGSPGASTPAVYVIGGVQLATGGEIELSSAIASIQSFTTDDGLGAAIAAPPAGAEAPDLFLGAPSTAGAAGAVYLVANGYDDIE